MITLVILAFGVVAVLLAAMWLIPAFKDKVATSWGAIGAGLVAILAWAVSFFAGTPPTIPPM